MLLQPEIQPRLLCLSPFQRLATLSCKTVAVRREWRIDVRVPRTQLSWLQWRFSCKQFPIRAFFPQTHSRPHRNMAVSWASIIFLLLSDECRVLLLPLLCLVLTAVYWCRSQWPRCLRRGSAVTGLLELRVRIPAGSMDVCPVCVLSGRCLCVGLIVRQEESYRVWCVWVWSRSLDNKEALAHGEGGGLSRHGKGKVVWLCSDLVLSFAMDVGNNEGTEVFLP
jgi:hypothetical protein